MKKLLTFVFLVCSFHVIAQSKIENIFAWQHQYKQDFLTDDRSPLNAADTAYLRFYPASEEGIEPAMVALTPTAAAVEMATHSGKTKRFRPYARLLFSEPGNNAGRRLVLIAYEHENGNDGSLFVPFNDLTNGEETYGGGRYLDLKKSDVTSTKVIMIDFNRAYNPYCAFKEGYSCPIPPVENRLDAYIRYGEMMPAPPLGAKE